MSEFNFEYYGNVGLITMLCDNCKHKAECEIDDGCEKYQTVEEVLE